MRTLLSIPAEFGAGGPICAAPEKDPHLSESFGLVTAGKLRKDREGGLGFSGTCTVLFCCMAILVLLFSLSWCSCCCGELGTCSLDFRIAVSSQSQASGRRAYCLTWICQYTSKQHNLREALLEHIQTPTQPCRIHPA